MAEYIECRNCDVPNCAGCNINTLATMLRTGKFDCIMDEHHSITSLPTVDAVEVVRCKDCKHGILDEEEGLWMCVFTADYDEELGVFHGFIQHNTADYYCADGERREDV